MEVKDFFQTLKKAYKILVIAVVFGALLGTLVYIYYPNKFTSSGSFYITRTAQNSTDDLYTYDGYYSQQTALSYTSTFAGLLESVDIRKKSLEELNIPVDENSLRITSKLIRAKKSAPQLINLEVKGATAEESENLWKSVASTTLKKAEELNKESDAMIKVYQLNTDPVVKEIYRNIYVYSLFGAVLGLILSVFVISFLKNSND